MLGNILNAKKEGLSSGPMMLLKSLGFDPQAMIGMFESAKDIITKFAETSEANHQQIMQRLSPDALRYCTWDQGYKNIMGKLDLIHADLKALNPDHAGDLGVPVEINGDTVSIGEALGEKIDREHWKIRTPEVDDFLEYHWTGLGCADVSDFLEYRRERRKNRTR